MGQQQLLLLVLGIVIVGLAVVVGIQAFSENQIKANADALVLDGVRIASDAQAWRLKPQAFGGGAANPAGTPWLGLDFGKLGYKSAAEEDGPNVYSNLNTGTGEGHGFVLTGQGGADLVITGSSPYNTVVVTVSGTSPDNIQTTVTPVP